MDGTYPRCSAGTLVTLPYAGQPAVDPQELSTMLDITTTASTKSTFFIVRSFLSVLWDFERLQRGQS